MNKKIAKIEQKAKEIRRDILDISYRAQVGHIGSALCIADIIAVLYNGVLKINPKKPLDFLRDRFILSKGHAAAALYAALYRRGFFSKKMLLSFCRNGGELGVHPDYNPRIGIEMTTGSLGQGLSVGTGLALGLREKARVFVLVSDAELNEGSTWEAIMFAAHQRLDNLIVIVDDNGLQALGKTREIINLEALKEKWKVFGWQAKVVDGHNIGGLFDNLTKIPFLQGKPSVIIAKTIMGKGVSFMENDFRWHYLPLDEKLYQKAMAEI